MRLFGLTSDQELELMSPCTALYGGQTLKAMGSASVGHSLLTDPYPYDPVHGFVQKNATCKSHGLWNCATNLGVLLQDFQVHTHLLMSSPWWKLVESHIFWWKIQPTCVYINILHTNGPNGPSHVMDFWEPRRDQKLFQHGFQHGSTHATVKSRNICPENVEMRKLNRTYRT